MESIILALVLALVSSEILASPFLKPYTEPPIPHTHQHGDHYHGERGAYDGQRKVDLDGQSQLSYGFDSVKKTDIGGYGPHKNIGGYGSPSLGHGPGSFGSSHTGGVSFPGVSQGSGGFGGSHKDIGGYGIGQSSGGIGGSHKDIGGYGSPGFGQSGSGSQSSAGSFSQSSSGSFGAQGGGHQSGYDSNRGIGSLGGHQSGIGGSGYDSNRGIGSLGGHQSGIGGSDYGHQTKLDNNHKVLVGHSPVSPGHRIDSVGDRYGRRDEEHVRTGSSSFSTAFSSSNAAADTYKDAKHVRY